MSGDITRILTNNSPLSNPAAQSPQPVLGFKNPTGDGAFPAVVQMVNGAAGVEVLQTVTDAILIASESPSTRRQIPVTATLRAYDVLANSFGPLTVIEGDDATDIGSLSSPLMTASIPYLFNGTTSDRQRSNSAANVAGVTQPFAAQVAEPGEWAVNSEPAVSVQASATKAAGSAGVRHVCRSLHFSLAAVAAQTQISCRVRDGASGAGTILWSQQVIAPAGSAVSIVLAGLNIVGSPATAMTFEWSAAPVATNFETAGGSGYSTI